MIVVWMLYSSAIGVLLWGAAVAAERVIRQMGGATRGIWGIALAASVILPIALVLRSSGTVAPAQANVGARYPVIREVLVPAVLPSAESLRWVDPTVAMLWLLASCAVVTAFIRAAAALRSVGRKWRVDTLAGAPVLVSEEIGPAVVGIARGRIVVPGWALDLDDDSQRLLLRHEREHIRAGDHRLLGIAALAAVAFPWNPAIWLEYRRLREAVEMDCDARVVRTRLDGARYGALLLSVAERVMRPSTRQFGLAAATPPLERRIRRLAGRCARLSHAGMLASAGAAILLMVVVPLLPAPHLDLVTILPAREVGSEATSGALSAIGFGDAGPRLLNAHEAPGILAGHHPGDERGAGIGGTVIVWAYVGPGGKIEYTAVQESSGDSNLDAAAEAAVRQFRFRAGTVNGMEKGMWTQQPIVFLPPANDITIAADVAEPDAPTTRLAIWTSPAPSKDPS